MIYKICIFNHKGGVSKTTTVFHVGSMLAKQGKKVLLIDADSQCNLTQYCLGYEGFEEYYKKNGKNNIKDALDPAFKALPRLIEPAVCISVKNNENLYLLPGNIDLSENDVQMGMSFQLANALGTMKNLPGAFNYLVDKTAESIGASIVIIDLNPSLSSINQDIFISSNFFIIPTSPDIFSIMAIKSLARILPNWESWAKKARPVYEDATYPLPKYTPIFMGFTVNDFNLSKGEAQKSFRELMNTIADTIDSILIPALKAENMVMPQSVYQEVYDSMTEFKYRSIYCLGEISNFNKLGALSNSTGTPVFELPVEQLSSSQQKTYNWFSALYEAIVSKINGLINHDGC